VDRLPSDAKRISYLKSVRDKLLGMPLLLQALERGTLADPDALPHTIRRCVSEINAVIDSFDRV
jgi:hypothetical protein